MNVWSFLHSLPHINHGFSRVSSIFVLPSSFNELWKLDTNRYQQSIQMFAIISILIGVIYLIICSILFCCRGKLAICKCCSRSQSMEGEYSHHNSMNINGSGVAPMSPNAPPLLSEYQGDIDDINAERLQRSERRRRYEQEKLEILRPCAMYWQFFIALFIVVAICVSVYFGYLLNNTILDIENHWDYTYQPYDTALSYGKLIENTISQAITECNKIKAANSSCSVDNPVNTVEKQLESSYNYVTKYRSIALTVSWGDSGEVDNYRQFGVFTGIGVLAFCALLLLVVSVVVFLALGFFLGWRLDCFVVVFVVDGCCCHFFFTCVFGGANDRV